MSGERKLEQPNPTCGECRGCTDDFCIGASVVRNGAQDKSEAYELGSIYTPDCFRPEKIEKAMSDFTEPQPLDPLNTFKLRNSSSYNY